MITRVESAALSTRGPEWNSGSGVGLLAILENDDFEASEEEEEDKRRIGNERTGVIGRGKIHRMAFLDYRDGGCQTGLLGYHGENPRGGALQVLDITGGQ